MVKVLLVRHGNTFAPGDKVIWVGAKTDLPLVPSGKTQAEVLGKRLHELGVRPDRVLAGPLKRTVEHAQIAVPEVQANILQELREINYGRWEAKSSDEIRAAGDGELLEGWDKRSVWPEEAGWQPAENDIERAAGEVLDSCHDRLTMVVSSNGILRFFARHAANANEIKDRKVLTGAVCLMERSGDGWKIRYWNCPPDQVQF
jgi:broad specificity phosphatase PhoE